MIRSLVATTLIVLVCGAPAAFAQEPAKPVEIKQAVARAAITALMVDVTIARTLNDKVMSSAPYTLAVHPDNKSSLRMGGEVPVPSTAFTPKEDGKGGTAIQSYGYRSIGTNIDVTAAAVQDGQYRVLLVVEENSIYPIDVSPASKATGAPSFRSFRSQNTLYLRDGQSVNYTAATDRLSGEVFKVTVKMTVVR